MNRWQFSEIISFKLLARGMEDISPISAVEPKPVSAHDTLISICLGSSNVTKHLKATEAEVISSFQAVAHGDCTCKMPHKRNMLGFCFLNTSVPSCTCAAAHGVWSHPCYAVVRSQESFCAGLQRKDLEVRYTGLQTLSTMRC